MWAACDATVTEWEQIEEVMRSNGEPDSYE